jgi:hypothetical protein
MKCEREMYIFKVLHNDKRVNYGFIHFQSNDEIINEISVVGMEMDERNCKDCKINRYGILEVYKNDLSKLYNQSGKDSMWCNVRCNNGFGYFCKFKLTSDTIVINLLDTIENPCFFSKGNSK